MRYNYCEQFGFDAERRKHRLVLLGLGEADFAPAETLHRRVIAPNVQNIIEAFYEKLLAQDEFNRILRHRFEIDNLKDSQQRYLLSLGAQFDEAAYFEERLRVGLVHARVGVPLGLYASAYGMLQQLILARVPPEIRAVDAEYHRLVAFLVKIAALDMSLASDTYHLAKVQVLETSLQALRRAGKELRHKVQTDALTGAASHAKAVARLKHALQVAQRDDTPLCIAMVDLDYFKRVNDTHGHLVGDEVLRDVTARMRASVRDFDMVGRYGGEEFLIILENAPLATAEAIAERMRRHVEESPIHVKGTEIHLTVSLGLAAAKKTDSVESLLRGADSALYAAKAAGRNCIRVAEADSAVP